MSADRPFVFFGFVLQYLAQDLASARDIALSNCIFYAHRILEIQAWDEMSLGREAYAVAALAKVVFVRVDDAEGIAVL